MACALHSHSPNGITCLSPPPLQLHDAHFPPALEDDAGSFAARISFGAVQVCLVPPDALLPQPGGPWTGCDTLEASDSGSDSGGGGDGSPSSPRHPWPGRGNKPPT